MNLMKRNLREENKWKNLRFIGEIIMWNIVRVMLNFFLIGLYWKKI